MRCIIISKIIKDDVSRNKYYLLSVYLLNNCNIMINSLTQKIALVA
jgi:hypothetical protein